MSKSSVVAKVLLSFGMPVIFLLAFFFQQIVSGNSVGWINGFTHPLTGWDHLVTMLAVGIWAAQLRGQAIWMLPLAFVGVMSLGGVAGAAGVTLPSAEGIILLSCAVFGVLITRKIRFNTKINVTIVAFFAFFHGFAHGQEISASASLFTYTLGFMLATLLLHGAGILVVKLAILTVTGLMSAIFSTAAIGEIRGASLESHQVFSVDVDRQIDATGFLNFQQGLERDFCRQTCSPSSSGKHESIDGERGWAREKFKELSGSVSYFRCAQLSNAYLQSPNKPFSSGFTHFDLQSPEVFDGGYALSPEVWGAVLLLIIGFSSIYPSINNTPGLLLSNGVGLNSPPTSKLVVISPKFPQHSRNTPVSLFEDISLQSVFAPLQICEAQRALTHLFVSHEPIAWEQWLLQEFLNPQSSLRSRAFLLRNSVCLFPRNTFAAYGFKPNELALKPCLRTLPSQRFDVSIVKKTIFNL